MIGWGGLAKTRAVHKGCGWKDDSREKGCGEGGKMMAKGGPFIVVVEADCRVGIAQKP
jgi:hypothetical protein